MTLAKNRRILGVLRDVGIARPRFAWNMVKSARQLGAGPAIGVAIGANLRGSEPAMIDEKGRLTFEEVRDRAFSVAAGLTAMGVGPGHNVGVLARNHRGFCEAMMGASLAGADALFLNTGFAGPQLGDVLEREGAGTLIYDEEFQGIVEQGAGRVQRLVSFGGAPDGVETLDSLADRFPATEPAKLERPGKATILTSGTTGTPKGANRSSMSPDLEVTAGLFERLPYRVGETMLISAPVFHSWGIINYGIGTMLANTIVFQRRFDPESVLAAIDEHRVEVLAAVPVMLSRILALGDDVIGKYDTRSLRMVGVSGSALPGELALRWMDTFGDNLHNLYGSTEASAASIALPEEMRAAPGTAGRPPMGTVTRIYDADGKPVPEGTAGRIFVGNSQQFEGYTGGGDKERIDGLMSIGDIGYFDENGLLFVEGRDDDMIVSGGENVFPKEVEDLLSDHADVAEAAVIGVPDEEFGARLKAFVVLKPGGSFGEDEVKALVRDQLARHKVPREVVYLEELPRNPTGKVLKRVLRDHA